MSMSYSMAYGGASQQIAARVRFGWGHKRSIDCWNAIDFAMQKVHYHALESE